MSPLSRQSEPELMDDPAQALAYAQADFSVPHSAFVQTFAQHFPDFRGGQVIDLGCGPADVTLRFAQAYPAVQITAVDGAPAMLELAAQAIAEHGLSRRIQLIKAYLPDSSFAAPRFDAVISNSLLHHLADPLTLWTTIATLAKPQAPIFVMDLRRPRSVGELHQLVETYAADSPPILRRDFYHSLCAAYQMEEVEKQLVTLGLPQLRVHEFGDRHLYIFGIKQVAAKIQ